MALSNGFDARGSSLVAGIDAAIERVVVHFEDNDIALRLDVLRALSAQAKLAFETERIRERLHQHPLTKDLIDAIATTSTVFERLVAGVSVDEYSCEYDAQRNVEILATVRWLLKDDSAKQQIKKRKKASASKANRAVPLILRYAYSRSLEEDGNTLVEFRVMSSVGVEAMPKELVHFAVSSSSPYPRSFYENQNDGDVSDDEQEQDDEEEARSKDSSSKEKQEEDHNDSDDDNESSEKDAGSEGDEEEQASAEEGQEDGSYGEAVEAFNFDDSVIEDIMKWIGEDDVDPADVIGFFLALPVSEDEWQLDERITEIVFNAETEGMSDQEEEGEKGQEAEDESE
uniref:Uncharacterized protein n=1 Tax=Globisporangium ultimum (strain ATCC 200006 / CBS 805.95 / DAOM BR144) TaxID=431595 RepID=K3X4P7_GLOUD